MRFRYERLRALAAAYSVSHETIHAVMRRAAAPGLWRGDGGGRRLRLQRHYHRWIEPRYQGDEGTRERPAHRPQIPLRARRARGPTAGAALLRRHQVRREPLPVRPARPAVHLPLLSASQAASAACQAYQPLPVDNPHHRRQCYRWVDRRLLAARRAEVATACAPRDGVGPARRRRPPPRPAQGRGLARDPRLSCRHRRCSAGRG